MTSQPDLLHFFTLLRAFLFSFLGIKDIAALDSACVSGDIRERFLASLAGARLEQLDCTKLTMKWIVKRRVLPGRVFVFKSMTELEAIMLSEFTSSVREIHVDCTGQKFVTETTLEIVMIMVRFSPQLHRIVWHSDREWREARNLFSKKSDVLFLASSCPVLKEITIHNPALKLADFRIILIKCKHLTTIDICECKRIIAGRGLESIVELCPQLASLSLSHSNTVCEGVLSLIATRCGQLTSFRIEETVGRFQTADAEQAAPVGFAAFAQSCPSLHVLHLCNIQLPFTDILILATRCPHLQDLSLGYFTCVGAPEGWFQQVAACFPDLRSVKISRETSVTDLDVRAMAQLCPNLRSVNLWWAVSIQEDTIAAIATHCTQLRSLACRAMALEECPILETIAHHCPHLRKLALQYFEATPPGLLELAQHCPLLEDLTFCCREDADYAQAAALLLNLRHLYIESTNPSDKPLLCFLTHCRQLRTVHAKHYFYPCRDVRIVRAIERHCPRLSLFKVSKCSRGVYNALARLRLSRARSQRTDFSFCTDAIATCFVCWTFDPEPLYW